MRWLSPLAPLLKLSLHDVTSRVTMLPVVRHYTAAAYARFLIPELVPGTEPILYVDGDILVEKDVACLPWHELGNHPVVAVTVAQFSEVMQAWAVELKEFFPHSAIAPYFGSGVLLINLPVWRENRYDEVLLKWAEQWGSMTTNVDQDLMNLCFQEKFKELSASWNFHISFPASGEHYGLLFPAFTHVSNHLKPWMFPARGSRGVVKRFYYYLGATACPFPQATISSPALSQGTNCLREWAKSVRWQMRAKLVDLPGLWRQAKIRRRNLAKIRQIKAGV